MSNFKSILLFFKKNPILLILLLAGLLIRLINIEKTLIFLGDQGRDAIIVKRILTLQNLPLIGPPSSIGQVYLGPFYYYLIAPFLLIFRFNPAGLAIGVAVYSVLLSVAIFLLLKKLLSQKIATAVFFFLLFSPVLVYFSRFSWNPNLVPYFSFLTSILFILALRKQKKLYYILFGLSYGLSLQLHYSMLFLVPAYAFFILRDLFQKKDKLEFGKKILLSLLSFLFTLTPLILFEIRYKFLNLKNFLKILQSPTSSEQSLWVYLKNLSAYIPAEAFGLSQLQSSVFEFVFILIFILLILASLRMKDDLFTLSGLQIISVLIFSAFMRLSNYPHYFGLIYPAIYLVFSGLLLQISKKKTFPLLIFAAVFLINWIPSYQFLSPPAQPQLKTAQELAATIFPEIKREKFQVIGIPYSESTAQIQYFLEIWGKTPISELSPEKPDELFVFCRQQCENILGNPQWHIAQLKRKKIDKIWEKDDLKIFKIIDYER